MAIPETVSQVIFAWKTNTKNDKCDGQPAINHMLFVWLLRSLNPFKVSITYGVRVSNLLDETPSWKWNSPLNICWWGDVTEESAREGEPRTSEWDREHFMNVGRGFSGLSFPSLSHLLWLMKAECGGDNDVWARLKVSPAFYLRRILDGWKHRDRCRENMCVIIFYLRK